ncbi:L-lysine 6-transaminase [Pedobacter sp. MC2016-24]|uniref:L-lysine 6-transaminase n=1 Tax=Pedobacter sp. MC2016-24 TaxID=2780090 RepID=UPI001881FDCC|nr:L-lysine 6-transaminase [Pedobacter sp. MC2016-24]MBE9601271.1 L-lysine 6-transaminase [Pedobacter sp. MC2016-24]
MYQLTVAPDQVKATLSKHILADGLDLTYDLEKSQGTYIYDSKYNRNLLDFFTCFASVPLGYNHPKMIHDEGFKHNLLLAAMANPSNSDVYTQQYATFVDTFARHGMPDYLPHAFFIAGGGLAVENAIKVAMDWKVQKNFAKGYKEEKGLKVLHFEKAFHGRTGYTLSLTNTLPDKTKWFAKFDWPRVAVPIVKFPLEGENLQVAIDTENTAISQIKQAFKAHKDDICAIIVEPIQSEGGDNHLREIFLIELKKLADEHEAFLIYDEVQTGVALTGKFWCHQHYSELARPDILVFGKKMQVCGILVGHKVDQVDNNVFRAPSRINSTWGGNLVDMVRATQILQIIAEDELCDHAANVGKYLQDQLANLAHKYDKMSNIRGKGLLCAFDFPNQNMRDAFIRHGLAQNVMFLGCGSQTVRFRPALCMERKHIDEGIAVMDKILPGL